MLSPNIFSNLHIIMYIGFSVGGGECSVGGGGGGNVYLHLDKSCKALSVLLGGPSLTRGAQSY